VRLKVNKDNKIVHKNLTPHPSWRGHLKKEKYISTLPTGSKDKKKKRCTGTLCSKYASTKRAQIPHSDDYCEECFTYDIRTALSWKK
jgi:hypothetical protein